MEKKRKNGLKTRMSAIALASALAVTAVPATPVFAAAESKTNPVVSIDADYDDGVLIVGNTVKKTNFDVTGKKKDGTKEDIKSFTIKNPKITSESQTVVVSYKNKAGDAVTAKVPVKAVTDFKKINATLKDDVSLDSGSAITKDMFVVKAVLSNGKEKVLANDAFNLSTTKYNGTSTSMSVSISAVNAAKKEIKKSVKVTADKAVTKISAVYNGGDKDAGDTISPSDFTVTGINVGKETVPVNKFNIGTSTLDKASNSVSITYTNSFGKELKTTVKVPTNKVVDKITDVEYVGGVKNVGDALSPSDFKVTGQNLKKDSVDITNFTLSDQTLPKEKSTIKVSYVNSLGRTLTKTVSVTANNFPESMTAARTSTKALYVGDAIKPTDFSATVTYHDGSTKKISGSKLTLSKSKIDYANDVIRVEYKDAKSGITLEAMVTVDSQNTTLANGAYAQYVGDAKSVGDSVDASDFKVYAKDTSGSMSEVTDVSIKSGAKLSSASNTVTLKFKCTDGTNGEVKCTVIANDGVVDIVVDNGSSSTAYGEGTKITKNNIKKVINVYTVSVSGAKTKVTDFAKNNVHVYALNGGQEITGSGSLILSANKENNGIVVKRGDYSKQFYIEPDYSKMKQNITASVSSLTLNVGEKKSISGLITGEKGTIIANSSSSSIAPISSGRVCAKKAGSATITIYCAAATISGKQYNKSNTVKVKVTVKGSSTSSSTKKPATSTAKTKKSNSISLGKGSSFSMVKGKSVSLSSVATAKTTVKASSSNSSCVAVSSGKLVAKKTGTATITLTAPGNSTYKNAAKQTVKITVKAK